MNNYTASSTFTSTCMCTVLTWLQSVMPLLERIISSTFSQSWPSSGPPSTVHTLLWSKTMELRRWTGQPPACSEPQNNNKTHQHSTSWLYYSVQCSANDSIHELLYSAAAAPYRPIYCTWFVDQGRLCDMAIVRRRQCIAGHCAVVHRRTVFVANGLLQREVTELRFTVELHQSRSACQTYVQCSMSYSEIMQNNGTASATSLLYAQWFDHYIISHVAIFSAHPQCNALWPVNLFQLHEFKVISKRSLKFRQAGVYLIMEPKPVITYFGDSEVIGAVLQKKLQARLKQLQLSTLPKYA